ncbi:ABC transporter G family member 23-like [Oppia nitens]|uniref:ABC transporter G family member 23-like n=1 Tax=Oppia nitens TaxID=1686743 RepID=UPI0023DA7CAA|nr:ABC transporter G family member 23-like [Oppia nitens]
MENKFSSFPAIDASDDTPNAINVDGVTYGYTDSSSVLTNFTLRIVQGKIFALLGANGCGKTTVIKLILGRIKPRNGLIQVFGLPPAHRDLGIPGPGVGYMPQEIALFNEFTIEQCLTYFGKIYKMDSHCINNRLELSIEMLDLPNRKHKISELSGGQQRLVSLAITMIHSPPLLILDEPTVGVDSILRYRIWSYLEKICTNYGITVLITTHYIDEAKGAANVGFMSNGSMIRQSSPYQLIVELNCHSLEDVYLKLCQKHNKRLRDQRHDRQGVNQIMTTDTMPTESTNSKPMLINTTGTYNQHMIDIRRVGALIDKNYIQFKQLTFGMVLFFIIPLVSIYATSITVGSVPQHIPIAIYTGANLQTRQMSKKFLASIDAKLIKPKYYDNESEAIESIITGQNMFALIYPVNYSANFIARLPSPFEVSDETLKNSTIREYADHSNQIVATYVRYLYLLDGLFEFMTKIGKQLNLNPTAFQRPIDTSRPIFNGTFYDSHTYPSTGILFMAVYAFPLCLSAFFIVNDLRNKSLERSYVAGVKPVEVFVVHILEMLVLNTALVSELMIILVALVLPMFICSGVVWPSEAIPPMFRYITDWTPVTWPLEALRSLLFRHVSPHNRRLD